MDPIATRPLGKSGVPVTQLGFGGAPLGDFYQKLPDGQATQTMARALELGVTLVDTSPLYGYGLSEHRFGQVLRQRPRDSYVLSTKVGRVFEAPKRGKAVDHGGWAGGLEFDPVFDYSYDGAMRAFEQSLMRLGIPHVDILLIHDVDIWTHGSRPAYEQRLQEALAGAYKALLKLREEGVVKAIGVGVNEVESCMRFAEGGDFDCFLLAGRYTLLEQTALDDFLPLCQRRDIGIMLGGPYNSGILATGAVPGAKYNYKDAPPEILERVSRIEAVCRRHGVALPAAAIQFPLAHPVVASMIPGAVKPEEVERNHALIATPIPAEFWAELKREGLVREDAPVPA
ncbi:aldo/keto reductase [Inquilinus limosus]|uniref:Pyridoxal 4-dehydrogenase n=1 Tax=Inquilinus limosus MP06 TaxID=1398085 RepID=A0A0A0DB70_9PROT|nr:aldo/keto reductase [Inquilinus limosus]KGM34237.1 pyridoxal 4-dehydrogenase [Inquilinus limosus MP06]